MFYLYSDEESLTFEISEDKYKNLKSLFSNYINLGDEEWQFLKSKMILKYYDAHTDIDYNKEYNNSFIYLNDGVVQGVQNITAKVWYIYFNHINSQQNDFSHNVIQDFFHYMFHDRSNITFQTLTECEVLYMRYEDLEEFFIKFYDYKIFKNMISDIELMRINQQIEEHSDKNMYDRLAHFLEGKDFLFKLENFENIVENYITLDMGEVYVQKRVLEINKKSS
jgi:hypothetical protein